ncbi:response regulator transcription factor [Actinomycetospora sp. CA-101289]|uniref:helix-turn-helix transcriptional regulator n=1 Tax=Actinomycetospora sp. CA-101289 TaxID=3239893 RepID=UPI003D954DCE
MSHVCVVHDDRPWARHHIGQMLVAVPGVRRVVMAENVDDLVRRLTEEPGRVAVLGTRRAEPEDLETVHRVLATCPGVPVVVVGARDDPATVRVAVATGACGFLRWDASADVTATLLHATVRAWAVSPQAGRMDGALLDGSGSLGTVVLHRGVQVSLRISRREMQVLDGMCEGMSNAQIGRELYLSNNTVKSLARRLFTKLGVHERAHAVARAYRLGLLASAPEGSRVRTSAPTGS